MAIIMDLHNHCEFSFDSSTPMEENVKRAVDLKLQYLSITDHLDLFYPHEDYRKMIDIKGYFRKFHRLEKEYEGKIKLLSGIEVGIQKTTAKVNDDIIRSFPFDFVIGSIHEINGEDLVTDFVIEKFDTLKDFYKYYYEETQKAVESSEGFDVLGHIDYMDRYVEDISQIPDISDYKEYIVPTLKNLISRKKGIEINTAGPRKGLPYMHPKKQVLEWYKELGGDIITIGSDAHKAEDIGKGVEEACDLLKECGFTRVSIFEKRKEKKIIL
ncbi:MAG: histidinol-phosphatase HisJ family protein [Gallicola sp.]|nr:histidinol-phosphatase HisJ family protein [Gallicola sp.]